MIEIHNEELFNCCYAYTEKNILIGTNQGKVYETLIPDIEEIRNPQFNNNKLISVLEGDLELIYEFPLKGTVRSIQKFNSKNNCI